MRCDNCLNTGQVTIGQEENLAILPCPVCKGKCDLTPYPEDLSVPDDTDFMEPFNDNFVEDY